MSQLRSNPLGGLIKLAVMLFFIAVAVCIFAPLMLNGVIAGEINKHFDNTLTVGKADLSVWPLRLKLHDVHIKNPPKYTQGDALTIGEIEIAATMTNTQTVMIKSMTFSEVAGYPEIIDDTDNFTAYKLYLKDKWDKIPTGKWRWPVAVESIQVRNAWIGNQDPMVKLDDRNYDPIGTLQNPVSAQEAFIQGLDHVLTQQRNALPKLALENIKKKAGQALDSIGKALKSLAE